MTVTRGDLWRRAWAVLALVTALLFAFQAGPGHAQDVVGGAGGDGVVAAAAEHHPGDGDAGHVGHVGGAHCAGHCGGHSVTGSGAAAVSAAVEPAGVSYGPPTARRLQGRDREPLIRPPAA